MLSLSITLNAPPLFKAPSKKFVNTSRRQRSLLGCCSQTLGSEATAYSSSKSSACNGSSKYCSCSSTGCRLTFISIALWYLVFTKVKEQSFKMYDDYH